MRIAGIQKQPAIVLGAMNFESPPRMAIKAQALLVSFGAMLQSPLLLGMRLWWGWSFFQTGKGKLMNHADTAEFFQGLGIPLPGLNAWVAGWVECIGGLCLLLGFASRLMAIPFRSP